MIVKMVLSSEPPCPEEPTYVCRECVTLDADTALRVARGLRRSIEELAAGTGNYGAMSKLNLRVTLYTEGGEVWDESTEEAEAERPAGEAEWNSVFDEAHKAPSPNQWQGDDVDECPPSLI